MSEPRSNSVDEETAAPRPEFLPAPSLNTQTSLSPQENTSSGETRSPAPNSTVVGIGSQLGPYQLLDKLGEGGMGAVYKARHAKLGKLVALKILPQHVLSRPDALSRFEREMMAVGTLHHPNVVQAHDAGEIGGVHYLSMEYVEGQDLHELVKSKGPMSVINACQAIRQAALGLAAAHKLGDLPQLLRLTMLVASTDAVPASFMRPSCKQLCKPSAISVSISASFFCTSWLAASGRPNCWRSSTYCRAR